MTKTFFQFVFHLHTLHIEFYDGHLKHSYPCYKVFWGFLRRKEIVQQRTKNSLPCIELFLDEPSFFKKALCPLNSAKEEKDFYFMSIPGNERPLNDISEEKQPTTTYARMNFSPFLEFSKSRENVSLSA
jgi:hypothetical protein